MMQETEKITDKAELFLICRAKKDYKRVDITGVEAYIGSSQAIL